MNKFFYPAVALLATSMIACTNEEEPTITDNDQPVEIKLSAEMAEYTIESRGALNDFGDEGSNNYYFVHWDGDTQDLTDTPLSATIAAGGAISFSEKQYYNIKGEMENFVGYYPQGTNTNGTVTFTGLDGTQDILYAGKVSGNKSNPIADKAVKFQHKLAQLKFKFEKDASLTDNVSITALKVNGSKLPKSLNLADGALTFEETVTPIIVFNKTEAPYYTADATPTENVLVEPGASIELEIKLDGVTDPIKVTPTFSGGATAAKTAYTITLTFKQKSIDATAQMNAWENGTGTGEIQ